VAADRYDVFFKGQILPDANFDQVKKDISQLLKASPDKVDKLFGGSAVRLKKDIDLESAARIRLAFRNVGALIDITDAEQAAENEAPPQAATATPEPAVATSAVSDGEKTRFDADADDVDLLPAHSGSLEEFAVSVSEPDIDISNISMDATGADLDDTPPPVPVSIETDDLDLLPSQTGSLEEFAADIPDLDIDISDIDMAPTGVTLDESAPPAPANIDTGDLDVLPAENAKSASNKPTSGKASFGVASFGDPDD